MQLFFTVPQQEQGTRLGLFLRRKGLSASLIKSVKYTPGGLCVNTEAAKTNQLLQTGDAVVVSLPQEAPPSLLPEEIPLEILYEDEHLLVVNKPGGIVMHPTRTHKGGTLGNAFCALMQGRGQQRAFRPVGRLDGGTSGLVLCALNAYAAPIVAAGMRKGYLALATGCLPLGEGEICRPIAPAEDSVIRQQVAQAGRPATTRYCVVEATPQASLVLVWPLTGRTHQIRVHFAWLGHPLVADTLYGAPPETLGRQALHCGSVCYLAPGGKGHQLAVPPPPDFCETARLAGIQAEWEPLMERLAAQTCALSVKLV